jgi:hypothetical protein
LGIGDWGLGIGPNPQSPIPNPQSPIPIQNKNSKNLKFKLRQVYKKYNLLNYNSYKYKK